MSLNQAQLWYDFSLQQMAAESYLDQKDGTGFNKTLKFGNNNPRFHDDEAALPGATRMTARVDTVLPVN